MKPKLFTLFLALIASVGTMFAVVINGIAYNLNSSELTAEVTGRNYTGSVVIPSSVIYNSKTYSVTSIGGYAFRECTGLTSITIPNSVTSIGDGAFEGCSGLTSVTLKSNDIVSRNYSFITNLSGIFGLQVTNLIIGDEVTSIGEYAFYGCYRLNSVNIPNSVTSIGGGAFEGCSGLTSITIPNSVTSIGVGAFSKCTGLPVIDNVRYADTYLTEAVDKKLSFYTIKEGTKWIGNNAFEKCTNLTSITIPNSVTSIGEYAFYGCSGLTSITIPNSVTSIEARAFSGCSGLTSITIPNSVTSIEEYVFGDCYSLNSVNIPNSVTSIGRGAFYYCTGLTSATIGNGVTSIGSLAFWACTGLTSITIPNSVTSIEETAFHGCYRLTAITCLGETPANIKYSVFENCNSLNAIYVPCGALETYKSSWSDYATLIKYAPNPYLHLQTNIINAGTVNYAQDLTICSETTIIEATQNYGYYFAQWSDGVTVNPRQIELVLYKDTTFTAEFAKNEYTITTSSANPEWGKTDGIISALYLDEVTLTATPNYGYHFDHWNDDNTDNPRTITVTGNKTYQAIFAKNIYSITDNSNKEQGSISGASQAEYLDFVTLTAEPNYGYHFTQWSDGLKDNPRVAQITQDTTFTAEFAYDRVGTCGKDLALVWSYDPVKKVLTIGNAGSFDENMRYGVEAPNEMTELVIGNNVTAIGTSAFANFPTLTKVTIGEAVKTIGDQAFYNCVNLETIFNYRKTPNNAYSTAFDGVDKFECKLYVLAGSIDLYKNAAVWRDFYYTYAIGAEEKSVTTDSVTVEPSDNTATLTWPTNDNAATYTIQITKDGEVFCTLIFNMNGQLVGIAFAPSRNGAPQAHAAVMTANGMQFTVTGLNSATNYGFTLTAKDSQDAVLATYEGEFTTTSNGEYIPESLENVDSSSAPQKVMVNGRIFILRGDKTYTVTGQEVK